MIVVLSSLFVLVLAIDNVASFEKVYGAGRPLSPTMPQYSQKDSIIYFNDMHAQYVRNCNFFTTNGQRYCRYYKRTTKIQENNPTYKVSKQDINDLASQSDEKCSETSTGERFCQFYRRGVKTPEKKPSYQVSKEAIKEMVRQFKRTCSITVNSERICQFERITNY